MSSSQTHVLAIGNAIVDVLARVDNDFLDEHGMTKGSMTLIDGGRAEQLYGAMGPTVEMSGGSAANTAAGIASLGGNVQFIGRVRNDPLGQSFIRDIRGLGVRYDVPPASEGPSTARCLILVTPDAQRTMNTYLGASIDLTPEDIEPAAVSRAEIVYLEGYLWDQPQAKDAMRKAIRLAHDAGRRVALTLSDSFCVDRHRAEFLHLAEHHVDILFANEAEIKSLYQVGDFDSALQQAREHVDIAALTRSEKGSVILAGEEVHIIDAVPNVNVIDTTGAGDLYAAGFLYGLTHDFDLHAAGQLGALCAAEVIAQIGPRPQSPLKPLIGRVKR
ncbi:MAG TPA: adenosine kinase [Ferrovibrio sp.]|uniref:adenosine kinase n=1 Tax=Ferrovibrio sp. TaxID=1917215 RepID=UPI002B4B3CA5|nr:adenosine kinase [Ferrovibrio sp.]HLT76899.1 adenosine kinase [Ferrovibrio sp.]